MSREAHFAQVPAFEAIYIHISIKVVIQLILIGTVMLGLGAGSLLMPDAWFVSRFYWWLMIPLGLFVLGYGIFYLVDRRPRFIIEQHQLTAVIGGAGVIPKSEIVGVRWAKQGVWKYLYLRLQTASQVGRRRSSWWVRYKYLRPDDARATELTLPLNTLAIKPEKLVSILRIWLRQPTTNGASHSKSMGSQF